MIWPFTVLGIIAGALLAHIPGAMLGGVLGQVLDRRLKLRNLKALNALLFGARAPRYQLLFALLGRLAKSDGVVSALHIQKTRDEMRRLNLDAQSQKYAIAAFNQGKVGKESYRDELRALAGTQEAESLIKACWRMAWADQKVGAHERELLNLWGQWLGFGVADVEEMGKAYAPGAKTSMPNLNRQMRYQQALTLLGVSEEVDKATLKRAYRRLVSQHHPDKLAGTGASAERLRQATHKTSELHQAYELICRARGF